MGFYTVTGGAGFIGSHLADLLLAAGHSVRIVDDFSTGKRENLPPGAEIMPGDVTDPALMRLALEGADGCFHLAAIASVARANEDWRGTHQVNQTGTVTVLDAARTAGRIPVVYASSAAVYGDVGTAPAVEALRPAPLTAYGADKLGSELHGRVAFLVHGVPTLGLRFFNVYGPRQDPSSPYSGVISIFADRLARRQPVTINGDGQQTRDFIHVADVTAHLAAAMAHLERKPGAEVLNVCTGTGTSLTELVVALGAVQGGGAPLATHGPARLGDIRQSIGDATLAKETLGVTANIGLAAGLASMVAAPQPALRLAGMRG